MPDSMPRLRPTTVIPVKAGIHVTFRQPSCGGRNDGLHATASRPTTVIPAKAGIQCLKSAFSRSLSSFGGRWTPVCA